MHCVFHSIRFKVNKGWSSAELLFLCPYVRFLVFQSTFIFLVFVSFPSDCFPCKWSVCSFCVSYSENVGRITSLFLYVFYVSSVETVGFPAEKRTFSIAETYVSREENNRKCRESLKKMCLRCEFSGALFVMPPVKITNFMVDW